MLTIITDTKEYNLSDNIFVSSTIVNRHISLVIGFTNDEGEDDIFTTGRYFSSETASLAKEIWEKKLSRSSQKAKYSIYQALRNASKR